MYLVCPPSLFKPLLSLVALQFVLRVVLVCAAVIGSEGGHVVGTAGGRVGVVKEGREVEGQWWRCK